MSEAARPEAEIVLRLSGITKRFGPLVANDAISLIAEARRGGGAAWRKRCRQDDVDEHPFRPLHRRRGQRSRVRQALPPGEPAPRSAAGIGMVHQHFTLADQMSVIENIVLGTQGRCGLSTSANQPRARKSGICRAWTTGWKCDPDRMISDLSVGERQRVEILKALYREARILILDEPTAVLTPMETEALFATLKKLVRQRAFGNLHLAQARRGSWRSATGWWCCAAASSRANARQPRRHKRNWPN
jgi:hypothetical protein